MSNVDLNLYKIFIKVYECGSITKACSELYITQPSISYNIKVLENQLNKKLFNRKNTGIEPTNYAKTLYPYVKKAFETICSGELKIKELDCLETGVVKIGVPTNIGVAVLADYIKKFLERYPFIKIELVSKLLEDMIIMLENRELDFIVDFLPVSSERFNIDKKYLTTLSMCFVGNKNILSNCDLNDFDIKKLKDYPLIIPRENSAMRIELDKFLFDNNVTIKPLVEVSTQLLTQSLVEKGIGIGYFIKESIIPFLHDDKMVVIDGIEGLPKMKVNVAYIYGFLNSASNIFLEYISNN